MLNLLDGARTLQQWRMHRAQQDENGTPIDNAKLMASVRARLPQIESLLSELGHDGIAAIPGYWSAEKCAAARTEIDQLFVAHPGSVRRFSGGADKRVFGAEEAGPCCAAFHNDPVLKSIGEIMSGAALYNLATLGARIDATDTNIGSGEGWHRDAFGQQFKAILYLVDVTDENGPLEYVPGSQKMWRAGLDAALGRFPVPPQSRVPEDHMTTLVARRRVKPRRFPAKAGTVLLANTTGVHRGAPLKSGSRYALTNYYFYPYQIGKSLVEKFEPLVPGVAGRLAPFLLAEQTSLAVKHHE